MRLAFVIQRYGADIAGGAEQHCRQIVQRLASEHEIEILTTTAKDYTTWVGPDDYAPGETLEDGVRVRRFAVERPRRLKSFAWFCRFIHRLPHTRGHELKWIEAQGPYTPQLIRFIRERQSHYDALILYCYRYYHSFFGVQAAPGKSVLVPTAERDWAINLKIYQELFAQARGFFFITEEERDLVCSVADIGGRLSAVAGMGVDVPADIRAGAFRDKFGSALGTNAREASDANTCEAPLMLYIGRIHENKGCGIMFDHVLRYYSEHPACKARLALIGAPAMKIPAHERIIPLGFVSEEDKFAALKDCDLLVMPSPYESLSMVTLEAMAMGRPVLANGACDVLAGHCRRSGAGIAWRNYGEFAGGLDVLLGDERRGNEMGRRGMEYIQRDYSWPVVMGKWKGFLDRFAQGQTGA